MKTALELSALNVWQKCQQVRQKQHLNYNLLCLRFIHTYSYTHGLIPLSNVALGGLLAAQGLKAWTPSNQIIPFPLNRKETKP